MIFKDYYKILELETNKVNIEKIKTAYREQAKKYHPDVNIGNNIAEERIKDINEAYKVLSNTSSRRKYDRMWNHYIGSKKKEQEYEESTRQTGSRFSEFFNMFFGNIKTEENGQTKTNKKNPIKGENIETSISISIQEGFFGTSKKISLRTIDGKMKNFNIKVPVGIRDSEKIRLIGQGKAGENGGKNGDLLINVEIKPEKKFTLQGYDIYTNLCLTPAEAALGTRVKLEGIDDSVSIYVPAGIQSGEKIKIPAKGYKDGKGGRGELIATAQIMVPKQLTQEEKDIYEKLKQISKYNPRSNLA